jgi:hypothetical protein
LADLFRFVVLLLCAGLIYLWRIEIHHLIMISILIGIGDTFFRTAFASYLPSLVGRHRLIEAYGKLTISDSLAGVVGPAAAGAMLTIYGALLAIMIDASSYALSALAIVAIVLAGGREAPVHYAAHAAEPFWPSLTKGFHYIVKTPELSSLLARGSIFSALNGAFSAVIFLYYLKVLGLDQLAIGLLTSAVALGILIGGACTPRLSRWIGVGPAIVGGNVVMALLWIGLPFLPPVAATSTPILIGMYFGYGLVFASYSINSASLRQARTPDAILGRVEAAYRTVTLSLNAAGALLMGWIAQLIDLRVALGGLAALAIICALIGVRSSTLLAIRGVQPEAAES